MHLLVTKPRSIARSTIPIFFSAPFYMHHLKLATAAACLLSAVAIKAVNISGGMEK